MPTPFPFVANSVLTAAQLNSISELPTRTLTGSGAAVAADAYSRVILNGTSITYTINTSTFSAGQVVEIYNANSTTATIAAGAGVTLNGAAGLTLAQYQTAELYAVSATTFVLWKSDVSVTSPAVVQVKSAAKTDTFTTTSTTFTNVTGLSIAITPTSASNKVLVIAQVSIGGPGASTEFGNWRLTGGNSTNYVGDAASTRSRAIFGGWASSTSIGSMLWGLSMVYLDSPATTSATTYQVQGQSTSIVGGAIYVNRSFTDSDNAVHVRGASSITVMEVTP